MLQSAVGKRLEAEDRLDWTAFYMDELQRHERVQERGDGMTKREFLDTVFALAPNEANAIMDAFDEYVESNVVPTGRSGKERRMSKYIIEIPDDVQYVLLNGKADNKY